MANQVIQGNMFNPFLTGYIFFIDCVSRPIAYIHASFFDTYIFNI
jgi:hypothetical protein